MTHAVPVHQSYVHGRSFANHSGNTFPVVNPGTGKLIYEVEIADEVVLQASLESAKQGFSVWSAMSAFDRSRVLNRAVSLLRERNDELAAVEVRDTGKPWQEAVAVDVVSGADAIEYFAALAISVEGTQQDLAADFFYTRREPVGVCAGIGAWNYPLQIACWKSAPALACGNAMIFKPSEETPLGAIKLAEIFIEAGVPPGVFNVVQGAAEVGQWLTHNPVIAKKGFFVAPTIFADCTDDMTIVREEIFGPVMSILIFSYDEEVIARANNVDTGLAAGIFTLDIQRAHHVTHKLEAGICWINRYGLSPVEMPVGGNKLSGIGRENGRVTLDHYTELKSVYVGMSPIESSF